MSSLAEKTLETIAKQHITPVSPWKFRLVRAVLWIGIFAIGALAILVTGFALHIVIETDWLAYRRANLLWTEAVLVSLPILWIFLLIVFVVVGMILFVRTTHGYRYLRSLLMLGFVGVSVSFGMLLEFSPLDEPVENFFLGSLKHREILRKIIPSVEEQWSQPEYGLLGGAVVQSNAAMSTLELRDFQDATWEVDYEHATLPESRLTPDTTVKIIGKEQPGRHFDAHEIQVWEKKKKKMAVEHSSKETEDRVEKNREIDDEEDSHDQEDTEDGAGEDEFKK